MDNNYSDTYGEFITPENAGQSASSGGNLPGDGTCPAERPDYTGNFLRAKSAYLRLGFGIALLTMLLIVTENVAALFISRYLPDFYNSVWFAWALSFVPLYGIGLPSLYLVIRNVPAVIPQKHKMTFGHWLKIAVMGFGCMMAGAFVGNALMSIISALTNYNYTSTLTSILSNAPWWQTLLFTVILAPIGEEIIFRKLLIDRSHMFGEGQAILFSALMFGLFHGNLYQAFYAFLLGLLLGYIYSSTGRLWLNIALHMLINFVGGFLSSLASNHLDLEALQNAKTVEDIMKFVSDSGGWLLLYELYTMVVTGCLIASVIILIITAVRHKFPRLSPGTMPLERGFRARATFRNAGTICAIVACSLLFVMSLIHL